MKALALLLCALCAGCGSIKALENRASCTLDGQQAMVVSMYGPLGIASELRAADAPYVCAPRTK